MARQQEMVLRRMITFVTTLLLAGAILAGIYLFVSSFGEVRDPPPAATGQQTP